MKSSFLNGFLEEEIYFKQPIDYEQKSMKIKV